MFWADFKDFLGRFEGYSGYISLVLTIMDIDDWTKSIFCTSCSSNPSSDLNIVFSATTLQQAKPPCQKTRNETFQKVDPCGYCSYSSHFGVISAFTYCTWVSRTHSSPVLPPSQPQAL